MVKIAPISIQAINQAPVASAKPVPPDAIVPFSGSGNGESRRTSSWFPDSWDDFTSGIRTVWNGILMDLGIR